MKGKWLSCLLLSLVSVGMVRADTGRDILDAAGVQGGVVVHVGCGDGQLTTQLRPNDRYVVQGLDADQQNVAKARRNIRAAGAYGTVSVDRFDGRTLPYVDNFANLVVVSNAASLTSGEIMRVLAPRGVAYVKQGNRWSRTVKPWPEGMDEWTHYMHDPAGTCVGKDTLVGPPRRLKWVGSPRHARSHEHTASLQAMVSAKGRMFYVMDEGSRASIQLPSKYVLTARDAFNGAILWKKELPDWFNHLFPLKAGPAYMPRRLVAVDEVVYVSGGIGRKLLAIDAATGEELRPYDATETTVDLIVSDGTIFAVVDPDRTINDYKQESAHCWTESGRANRQWGWTASFAAGDTGKKQVVKAILAASGKLLWEKETNVAPMSIVANDRMLCLFDGASVVARDRDSGKTLWTSENVGPEKPLIVTGFAPKLIIHDQYVLYSPSRRIVALDASTGKTLWDIKGKPRSGHHSPEDLFVIDGIVWAAGTAAGRNSTFVGYDLKTGERQKVYPNKVAAFYMHQRCYPGRATEKYLLPAATGTEFVDLKTGEWEIHHWVRGGCIYGMMPANGMLYATPQACACYYQSKLNGFNALAAGERTLPAEIGDRLEKGPAYSKVKGRKPDSAGEDWPTFRHDNRRSGYAKTDISSDFSEAWKVKLSGRVSQASAADGKLFVAAVDEHTVYALDASSGKEIWSYTTGGRVDSPPTIYRGMAIFGSADGYIYALRAEDGELAWRFRAAPIDQRLMSYEQIESVWPLPGSVLIQDDPSTGQAALYCVAGRNMFVDGGLRMLRLNPGTGELLSENVMNDRIPGTEDNLQTIMKGKHLPVALPDILSSDGKYVYMKSQTFDMQGKRIRVAPQANNVQDGEERHLFSPISFLDDSWFHRAYWLYGRAAGEGWAEWQIPPKLAPYGRIMSVDEDNVYAYGRDPELLCNSSVLEYRLYCAKKKADSGGTKRKTVGASVDWKKLAELPAEQLTALSYHWQIEHPPVVVRAMVLANDTLFVAGPPDVVDEKQMWGRSNQPQFRKKMIEQAKALEGAQNAVLWAVSRKDGKKLTEQKLDFLPAFDGMIAADGRLFITTTGGELVCYR